MLEVHQDEGEVLRQVGLYTLAVVPFQPEKNPAEDSTGFHPLKIRFPRFGGEPRKVKEGTDGVG